MTPLQRPEPGPVPGDPMLTDRLRHELRGLVDETAPPGATATTRASLARARGIRARRRTAVAGVAVAAGAAVAMAVLPGGAADRGSGPPPVASTGTATASPAPDGTAGPLRFDRTARCSFGTLLCEVPQAMVGRGLRLAAVDIGSQPAEEPGAGIGMQVVNGRAPYAVAAGIVSAPGVRPSPVVVSVDGTRVARFPGGAVHQVRVARGTHWVRVRLDGPPSAHSLLAVVWYEAEAAPREAVGARP